MFTRSHFSLKLPTYVETILTRQLHDLIVMKLRQTPGDRLYIMNDNSDSHNLGQILRLLHLAPVTFLPGLPYRSMFEKYRIFTQINIEIKNITERYRYFDFSLEQDIISKPEVKKRGTPETK